MTKNITPTKFRCGDVDALCPSIHETENGIVFVGAFVSDGELTNLGIKRGVGETALRYPQELVDAFMVEWAAKKLANAK